MAKILITEVVHEVAPELLRAAGHEVILADRNPDIIAKEIQDADAVIVRIIELQPELLSTAKNLKVVSKHGVGFDNIAVDWCTEHNIAVTITPTANSQSVAEHALALAFALSKNLPHVTAEYKRIGFAAKNCPPGMELLGKTMGIIGCGRIGSRMAKMTVGLGMKTLIYDPYVDAVPEGAVKVTDKEQIFKESDVVTLHPALTDETRGFVGAKELRMMKPTALLINCGRGPMVDEDALIEALKTGKIAGAGLDVTKNEPCEPESPLFTMDNVILTPHYAPTTREASYNVARIAAENIIDILNKKVPEGLLNKVTI